MSKQTDFINAIAPIAIAEYKTRDKWILPSVLIAQAALESGWNIKAKTLFGIKGKGVTTRTKEYLNGRFVSITDSFQKYPNIGAAVDGYINLLTTNSRYKGAVCNRNYRSTIEAIKRGGYATDPGYVRKVCQIIQSYGLTKYDSRAVSSNKVTIACDGIMGPNTTKRTQKFLGTTADGVISGQYKGNIANAPGITTMKQGRKGSSMVRALQKYLGVEADGHLGPNTIKAWQRKMGTPEDGSISKPSALIKKWQSFLNMKGV